MDQLKNAARKPIEFDVTLLTTNEEKQMNWLELKIKLIN
jgi:hypothetical protein